ncbi:MAG: cell envelope integrity protein TolA [Holosporales bacterium]|jgi:hypothetical protein|nr:cell envelope integrity protein TolA [Holosporales bacterium]
MNYLAVFLSLLLHAVVILFCYVGLDGIFSRKLKDSGYAVFDFVEIGHKSKAPILSNTEGKASKSKSKTKENDNLDIKTQPTESSIAEEKEDKASWKNKPSKTSTDKKKEKEISINKKNKDKHREHNKPEGKKRTTKPKAAAPEKAVRNLRRNKKKQPRKDQKVATKSFNSLLDSALATSDNENMGAKAEEVGEVLTATQIDLIRQTIRKCWHFPAGLKNAEDLIVDIKMELDENGNVKKAEILNKSRANSDPDFKIASENAYRAVLDPNCNPLPLPKEKYNEWKELELSFNPKDMFE